MKKTLLCLAAVSSLGLTALPATAQTWQNINQRQVNLDTRIDQGVRNGTLSRTEALSLRAEFRDIARLEARYRATSGLSGWERQDLDRRFNALSARIRVQRADNDNRWIDRQGRWMNINQRQDRLEQRIQQGVRSGQLTRAEAVRLRAEFRVIAQLESRYRRNGLTASERADLDRRFDVLAHRVHDERRDGQRQYGWRW